MKKGFIGNIEKDTIENDAFRTVIYTGSFMQLVLMSIAPGEDIGEEVHDDTDQFIRCEAGVGTVIINEQEHLVADGVAIVVPAGATHNVINTSSDSPLKLYTLYAPPHHKEGTVHSNKEDAEEDDEHYDGVGTEE